MFMYNISAKLCIKVDSVEHAEELLIFFTQDEYYKQELDNGNGVEIKLIQSDRSFVVTESAQGTIVE